MSEFDKEAERERLREKFEAEREDREATQRMSELLLQGATMTNRHCEECGDPIFRYEGEEFCPTCQTTHAEAANGETAPEGVDEAGAGAEAEPEPDVDASPDDVDAPTEDRSADDVDQAPPTSSPAASATEPPTEATPAQPRNESQGTTPSPDAAAVGPTTGEGGDLAASRATVSRTLAALARRAEETDDLGRKRSLLAAVREAAEAIAAIDEATR